jgi:hypothetical protein
MNFVDAYDSSRKIVCSQYASLTYLLCDRFDIDCKIISGNNHIYNAIRLDTEDTYSVYDLTKTSLFMPAKVGFIDMLSLNYTPALEKDELSKALNNGLNSRIVYHFNFTVEEVVIIALVIAIIVCASYKPYKKRSAKRRNI